MALSAPRHLGDGTMSLPRSVRLIWWVTWFNVRMLLVSEFFVLLTFVSPLIFATLAFFLFRLGHSTGGQTLLYAALGSGMMGVWSTTLFGCGGAIAWQRWEGTLELLVNAPTRYDFILAGQNFGAVIFGYDGILMTIAWGMDAIRGATLQSQPPWFAIGMCFALAVVYYFLARVALRYVLHLARRDATLDLR